MSYKRPSKKQIEATLDYLRALAEKTTEFYKK